MNAAGKGAASQRVILLATSVSYAVIMLDTSVVNVALQRIATGLSVPLTGLQWVMSAYTLAFASALLTGGALGDRWGARKVYMAGLLMFTLASVACGLAPNPTALIVARAAQGIGAALLVPCSLKLIHHACPDARQRARAIGLWTSVGGIAMTAGPLVGGALTQWLGWRSIFFVNLPIGLFGLGMASRITTHAERQQAVRFDLMGQVTAIVALATLIGVLIEGQALGWASPRILAGTAVAVAAGAAFLWIEMRSPHAMLPLTLFKQGVFSRSTVVSLVSAFVSYGLFFATSLNFREARGYSPWQTGLAFLPMTAMVTLASMLSHRIAQACGATLSMCMAFGLYALGAVGLWVTGASSAYAPTIVPLLAIGLASGFISPAATAPAMQACAPDVAGVTAATLNAARQTGAAFGVAIFGALLTAMPSFHAGMRAGLWTATSVSLAAALALAIPRCSRIPQK